MNAVAFLYLCFMLVAVGWWFFVVIKLASEGNGVAWLMIAIMGFMFFTGCRAFI